MTTTIQLRFKPEVAPANAALCPSGPAKLSASMLAGRNYVDNGEVIPREFESLGRRQERRSFWVPSDERLMRRLHNLPSDHYP